MGIVSGGGGGGTFNGGTITRALDIEDAQANTTALKVHSVYTDAQGNDTVKVESADSTQRLLIQSDGTTQFAVDSGGADFRILKGGGTRLRVLDQYTLIDGGVQLRSPGAGAILALLMNDGTRGYFSIQGANGAVADASLNASEFSLWLDDTVGATKLMVKAKDSGGTVRAAAIALT